MNRVYHSNRNIVYSCKYHIVFCPSIVRKVLVNGVDVRLKELIQSIAAENHFEVIEMEIMPDHVHLLLEVDPQFRNSQSGEDNQGQNVEDTKTGISLADNETADTLDKFLFLFYGRRCAAWNRQAVYREPKDIAKEVRKMETYTLGYKFRIYPNRTQENLINRTLGCARFVFNHFLAVRRDEWKANHNSLTYVKTNKLLTDLKKREETAPLSEADSMALQESLRNLDCAFQNFFAKRARYPRFKSKHSHSQSYRTRNQANGIRIIDKRIKLPKIGLVRIKQSRDFDGRILSATVSRAASGKYYVSLCVEAEKESLLCPNNGKRIGIDVGLKVFYSDDSNGDTVENPHPLKKLQRKLRREQRRFSRKMPKSVNRERARVRVARVHERIANIRRDFLHKISTRLARENQTVAVEHLNIKGMLRNRINSRSQSQM